RRPRSAGRQTPPTPFRRGAVSPFRRFRAPIQRSPASLGPRKRPFRRSLFGSLLGDHLPDRGPDRLAPVRILAEFDHLFDLLDLLFWDPQCHTLHLLSPV